MKSALLQALADWADGIDTQTEAAAALGVAQARISEIKNGRLSKFSSDLLIRLAARAGVEVPLSPSMLATT